MKNFRLIDNLTGWLIFAIAAFTYCSTVEPTASFWDCPEFITTAYKMEVGHPPGAPFFMIMGNLFTQLGGSPANAALCVNIMNALLSAFCILFLFWSITHLARKLVGTNGVLKTNGQLIAVEASGAVGALIYTFSDTFWYSAVEGEVYAFSSLFTAVVVWLMLKWEDNADKPHSDRWLILIAYLTGLSVGVHLLNLLCLPALVLIFYYRKFPNANLKGSFLALLVSFALIAVVLYGIVPGIVKVGGQFELLAVNTLGLPFNTGLFLYIISIISAIIWAIWESVKQKSRRRMVASYCLTVALLGIPFYGNGIASFILGICLLGLLAWALFYRNEKGYWFGARLLNTSLLCMMMILIGYSSYAVIMIRSAANPPMDQNSPEDIFTLGTYLNREQYGDTPLLYGQTICAEPELTEVNGKIEVVRVDDEGNLTLDPKYPAKLRYGTKVSRDETGWHAIHKDGDPIYFKDTKKGKYGIVDYKPEYQYDVNMFFPRMYTEGTNNVYIPEFKSWVGIGDNEPWGKEVTTDKGETVTRPSFFQNMKFFLSYQVNFMYWRYFLWNFVGRQNDVQNTSGNNEHGNWITGISFIDNARLGDQSQLPQELKDNKGHNVYYCLPLLLGLLGLAWQVYKKGQSGSDGVKQFWVVFFLFFMTGLAIVVYLNQPPLQPRERDYAYAGSFYAFAIWCGLGVAAIADVLKKLTKKELPASIAACAALLVPVQMASQNWDDHDRSDRYTARDFGFNYLNSLQEKSFPIIFTNGDNDTFPLWYAQETEGVRTDARVCNLSYLQTDWYIDQMRRPAYDSPGLPITWTQDQYRDGGNRDIVYICECPDRTALVKLKVWEKGEWKETDEHLTLEEYKQVSNMTEHVKVIRIMHKSSGYLIDELGKEAVEKKYGKDIYSLENVIKYWVLAEDPIIPTYNMNMPVDKEAVLRSGMKIMGDIPEKMTISLEGKGYLQKSDLMMLEMLLHNNWERPMYIAVTASSPIRSLNEYLVKEGLAYRITPFHVGRAIDTDRMYENVTKKFKFGNFSDPNVYLDETIRRMGYTHRRELAELARELAIEAQYIPAYNDSMEIAVDTLAMQQKAQKARTILNLMDKELPATKLPHKSHIYDLYGSMQIAQAWTMLDEKQKATDILVQLIKTDAEYINYYMSQKESYAIGTIVESRNKITIMAQMYQYIVENKLLPPKETKKLEELISVCAQKVEKLLSSTN